MQKQKDDIYTYWCKLIEAVIRDVPGLTFIKEVKLKKENYQHHDHTIIHSAKVKYDDKTTKAIAGEGDWIHQDTCDWFKI